MRPEPNPAVRAWLNERAAETLSLSSATLAELLFSIGSLPAGKRKNMLDRALNERLELFKAKARCCRSMRMLRATTQTWLWRQSAAGEAS